MPSEESIAAPARRDPTVFFYRDRRPVSRQHRADHGQFSSCPEYRARRVVRVEDAGSDQRAHRARAAARTTPQGVPRGGSESAMPALRSISARTAGAIGSASRVS